jgi:hypothetical protein
MNRLGKLYLPFLIIIVASAYLLSYYLSYKVNGEDYGVCQGSCPFYSCCFQ